MNETVLIAEDDVDVQDILSLYLSGGGYTVETASDGAEALAILRAKPVSIVLLDIMMPGTNGYDFIKTAREFSTVPIIIVSARTQAADKMVGLDLGADGYICKPFDPMEVIAYVRALLRRCAQQAERQPDDGLLKVGRLELDRKKMLLRKDGNAVPLTATELKVTMHLMEAPGRIFTKAQLYEAATGAPCIGAEESITVHISNIRAKLEDDPGNPSFITTVRGLGYRFEA